MTRTLPLLAALASTAFAVPASAQETVDTGDDSYNMVIVYGDDTCPQSTVDQIVVCARKAESERYRIPERLRLSDSPENQAWAERVERFETIGSFGALSCSPTGAGGFTGCTQQLIDAAYADKENSSEVRFGQLVAEARAERLSTIDAEAAAEQERVEMIEREYQERLERERDGEGPAETAEELPQPEG
ncbi:hypothetical protein [Erythrobacter mangrovi]|uniref:Uncharacterized protein n=1 Tax=Erythrobacter mangrovi TaxID=2739433 RepID=A0A7D4B779_9SPHN|nr:hypothetical protein [Erythrobacter mangrovi]QKG70943.1 hypothetical protein HQR01_05925 [Erythrobacter mangrovi]